MRINLKRIINNSLLSVIGFLIFYFPQKGFSQFCSGSLGAPIVNISFGAGITNPGPQLSTVVPGATTNYNFAAYATGTPLSPPLDGDYALLNKIPQNYGWHTDATDHTGNTNGYMAFFNAAPTPGNFYQQTVSNLCSGTTYEFAAWVANAINPSAYPNAVTPNLTFKIIDPTTQIVLGTYNTGDISSTPNLTWKQFSMLFTVPGNINTVSLIISNNNIGGNILIGNDLAIDDITFRPCGPKTSASFSNSVDLISLTIPTCNNVNLYGKISGGLTTPTFQWQISSDNGATFSNIQNANSLNYIYTSERSGTYQFRLISAESGNITSATCSFISNPVILTIQGLCSLSCNSWLKTSAVGSSVKIGDLDISGDQLTVEASFNRILPYTGSYLYAGNVVSKHNQPSDCNYLLRPNNAQITTTNGFYSTPNICDISLNKTYHIAMVYNGSSLKFYRNGYLMSQIVATGNLIQNNWITTLGDFAPGLPVPPENLIGYINEVRIWNVARSQNELKTYMYKELPNPPQQNGLMACYTFNDLLNKQGNPLWNGILTGTATIGNTNTQCTYASDSCTVTGIGNIINEYAEVINLNPCANTLILKDASKFNIGDTVLLIQMKGAIIDSSNTQSFGTVIDNRNAGNYEFNYVSNKTGNTLTLKNNLTRQYDLQNGKVQLVRVPFYKNVQVTSTLTCLPWDGSIGGILVLSVQDTIMLNADIDVSGKGFRGGNSINTNNSNWTCGTSDYYYPLNSVEGAAKGEGIAEISTLKAGGIGPLSNGGGGGNQSNCGGGGGGNGGTGGFGGYQFEYCRFQSNKDYRGIGGYALNYVNQNKVFLGGGGGAGDANNPPPNNFRSMGGNGGGIVIINADVLKNTGYSIVSDGDPGLECTMNCFEGMGGGGSGGTVLFNVNTVLSNLPIRISGGKGADAIHTYSESSQIHGPGGGGGGGVFYFKQSSLPANVSVLSNGGLNGVNTNFSNNPWGATSGQNGLNVFNLTPPIDNAVFKAPIDSVRINETQVSCNSFSFKGLAYTNATTISSWHWDFGDGNTDNNQNTSHRYSATNNYTVKLVVTDVNGCKDSILKTISTIALNFDFFYTQDLCNPLSVKFQGVGNPGTSQFWSFGDANTLLNSLSPTHNYLSSKNYTVKYAVSGSSCSDTITKIIFIGLTDDNIILTPDTIICLGGTKKISTTPVNNFCWNPVTFLDNPNSANPTTSTNKTITYYLTSEVTGNNQIVNGDFSGGNTGFSSDYLLNTSSGFNAGVYTVGSNILAWHPSMSNCKDHTSGNGNMMLVNGADNLGVKVWNQTINVIPNTTYSFSTWLQNITTVNPSKLQFSINGNQIGNIFTANTQSCIWEKFSTTWNSGNSNSATISIVNQNSAFSGNDFALDDISFAPVFIKQDSIRITVDTPAVKTIDDDSICIGGSVQLNTTGASVYQWSPAAGISNVNIPGPNAAPVVNTQYIVTGTNGNGCTAKDTVNIKIIPNDQFIQSIADDSICTGKSIILSTSGGNIYNWLPASSLDNSTIASPTASPQVNTQYIVKGKTPNGCDATDTVNIFLKAKPAIVKTSDPTICQNASVQLNTSGGVLYEWQSDNSLNALNIANPVATPSINKTYYVTITGSNQCKATDSIKVFIKPKTIFSISPDASICEGTNYRLQANGGDFYLWSPADAVSNAGISNPIATPHLNTTIYTVKIKESSCNDSALLSTRLILNNELKIKISKSNDIDCSNSTAKLFATGGTDYIWTPSWGLTDSTVSNPEATIAQTQKYIVKGSNENGCFGYDSIIVYADFNNTVNYYMPNAFSPNGDGLNDCYSIKYWGFIKKLQFSIYDRWGNLIFYTENPKDCWDGLYKGKKAEAGTYVYQIFAETMCGKTNKKGNLVLVQ